MVTYDLLLTQDNFKSERVTTDYYFRTTDTNSDSSRQAEMQGQATHQQLGKQKWVSGCLFKERLGLVQDMRDI